MSKRIIVEIKVKNIADNVEASQPIAGGLPQLNIPAQSFPLDATDDEEELLYKLYTNVLATYCKAVHGTDNDDWVQDYRRKMKVFKEQVM